MLSIMKIIFIMEDLKLICDKILEDIFDYSISGNEE